MWEHVLPIVGSWQALAAGVALVAFAFAARWISRENPREEPFAGFAYLFMRVYSRLVHRLRVEGRENIPGGRQSGGRRGHGPVVLVANHTAGVDPVLIQAAVPFEVRFLMARDMQPAALRELWEWVGVIPVNRDGPDAKAARAAIRWLKEGGLDGGGGVIGIFPEGGIERPRRRVLPFLAGIGLLVLKGKARVLPVVIDGTPYTATAWGSLVRRSRSRVRFLPMIDYAAEGVGAAEIAADLRRRFVEATGWETNDAPEREQTQS
jgi:1-acyl-sn-glycerol-3-phosphate acyltransferase